MSEHHRLQATATSSGIVFECEDDCDRRLVIDRTTGAMTIIDHGDRMALHRGGLGDVEFEAVDVLPEPV